MKIADFYMRRNILYILQPHALVKIKAKNQPKEVCGGLFVGYFCMRLIVVWPSAGCCRYTICVEWLCQILFIKAEGLANK